MQLRGWRLPAFLVLQPPTRVALGLICDYDDFRRGGYDLGISYHEMERSRPADLESVLLRREVLAPACAPGLLKGPATSGVVGIDIHGGQVFQTLEMAISAAMAGLGVAIADLQRVREELASGRLIVPFGPVATEGTGYRLFTERGRFEEPRIAAFRDWLLAEAAADGDVAHYVPALLPARREPPVPAAG